VPLGSLPRPASELQTVAVKRHPLLAFLALTLVLSWSAWLPALPRAGQAPPTATAPVYWQMAGEMGPGVAAMIVALGCGGLAGLKRLVRRVWLGAGSALWYAVALLLPPICSLLTTALYTMFGGDAPDFSVLRIRHQPWLPIVLGVGTACLAELGWRGFALPYLQSRTDALGASVALAVLWAGWGLPLSLSVSTAPVWWTVCSLVLAALPGSILVTWLFNNARGSLGPVIVFNLSVKFTDLLLAAPPASLTLVLAPYWLVAVVVVSYAGAARLSHQALDPNCLAQDTASAAMQPADQAQSVRCSGQPTTSHPQR
jgi:membrane protease YdiL (CAAX protease family)